MRAYFGRLYQAEVNFSQAMARLGFSEAKLAKYLEKEAWILEVYQKFKNEKQEGKREIEEDLQEEIEECLMVC